MMQRTKGLNPMSAKRRAELVAAGELHPTSTLRRKPVKAAKPKRPKPTGPDQATVDLVLSRDNWSCVVCGDALHGERGGEWSIHHRLRRSQGLDNRPANLIAVCGDGVSRCHGAIHASPARAREGGWLIKGRQDPAAMPVAHSQLGWVLLDNRGAWTCTGPPADRMAGGIREATF